MVNYRAESVIEVPRLDLQRAVTGATTRPEPIEQRETYYPQLDEFQKTPVYRREGLVGYEIDGPAIIEQMDTTIMIEPTQTARTDEFGNIIIEVN